MAHALRIYGEPGTLYARCGGVFGVSSFVDRCMDAWMADNLLNANPMVARWHASAQRPGFKFLVVQIVCSLTGGPQTYTGRPMDQAHKHLNISEAEWDAFMGIFNDVCGEFGLPSEDVDDLNALMISMMDECVVFPGERPRPDPGPLRPGGHSVYGRVGGVYPIALFVDRLVDALLLDDRVAIPVDGHKRNESSLKYLLTEQLCREAGGPEAPAAPIPSPAPPPVPRSIASRPTTRPNPLPRTPLPFPDRFSAHPLRHPAPHRSSRAPRPRRRACSCPKPRGRSCRSPRGSRRTTSTSGRATPSSSFSTS